MSDYYDNSDDTFDNSLLDDYITTTLDEIQSQYVIPNGTKDIEVDPYENYITLSVKKAQLSWTFKEHLTKMKEVREFIIKTRAELKDLDQEYPEFAGKYLDKYMQARKDAGIDESTEDLNDNFMNFMVEEKLIPTIDTDEKLPEFE